MTRWCFFLLLFPFGPLVVRAGDGGLNRFARDPKLLAIRHRQDERALAPLLAFLTDPAPIYRAEAARALASVLAPESRAPLTRLLSSDPDATVRRAAAHALGLLADTLAQPDLLRAAVQEANPATRAALLEALGRVATPTGGGLGYLADGPLPPDPVARAGWAWGLYRAATRRVVNDAAVARAVSLLAVGQPRPVRLAAAHLLARTPRLDLTSYEAQLLQTAERDSAAEVRIAATQALGRVTTPRAGEAILTRLQTDADPRVRVAALRAASQAMRYDQVKEAAMGALADANHNVQVQATDYLLAKVPADEPAFVFRRRARRHPDPQVQAALYAVALRLTVVPDSVRRLVEEVKTRYATAGTPTKQAFLLRALGQQLAAWRFVAAEGLRTPIRPIVSAAAAEALTTLRAHTPFPDSLRAPFLAVFQRAIGSGDVAVVSTVAGALREPAMEFKKQVTDLTFLREAKAHLTLPRDVETAQELDQTMAFLSGQPAPAPTKPSLTHPTDWARVLKLPANQRVTVTTNRGQFMLELLVDEAPASVATFAALVDKKFYDGLLWHRVVPGFVAQGGDPRGDGSGGLDYTLRSELTDRMYLTGAVGLASAGLNTESCQWFAMLGPAPHLDGRYTLFARVVEGQEVIENLRVGDVMSKVRLK